MKTLYSLITDYIYGLTTWVFIFMTVCVIGYETQYIITNNTLLSSILIGFSYTIIVIFAPLGVTYIAKSIKETKQKEDYHIKGEYVSKRF
jgi:hypothetical protein